MRISDWSSDVCSSDLLQFGDDLHAAHLGAAGDGAAGEHGADHAAGRGVGAQAPAHVADDVVHVRVAFHAHQFVDLDAAGHAYAAQVVALQVDQHPVLEIGRAPCRERVWTYV